MRSHNKVHVILCSVYTCTCMHMNAYTHHSSPPPCPCPPQCYPAILQEVLERLTKVQKAFEIRLFCEVMLSAFHKLSGTNTLLSKNLVSEWVVWYSLWCMHAYAQDKNAHMYMHSCTHLKSSSSPICLCCIVIYDITGRTLFDLDPPSLRCTTRM